MSPANKPPAYGHIRSGEWDDNQEVPELSVWRDNRQEQKHRCSQVEEEATIQTSHGLRALDLTLPQCLELLLVR
jgi:hypothetical protein